MDRPSFPVMPPLVARYVGRCFCGAVELLVTGAPRLSGYCHCDSCRHWSAAPLNSFTLWEPDAVRIVEGEEHVRSYSKGDKTIRKWCNICGGHLLTYHQKIRLMDVYPAVLQNFHFEPAVHLCFHKCVAPIRDALAKKGINGEDVPEQDGAIGSAAERAGSVAIPMSVTPSTTSSSASSSAASSTPASATRTSNGGTL